MCNAVYSLSLQICHFRQKENDVKLQKEQRRKLREEKRKVKILEKLEISGTEEINAKIAKEEKKLLKVQRQLEAIRLVEELFSRIKVCNLFVYSILKATHQLSVPGKTCG